jgi:adenylate cyclase
MTHSDKALLEKFDHLIDENLDNSTFSTDKVCQDLGISRSQLFRILKDHTQLSSTLYIRKRKLAKAKNLLSTTEMRVSEIADAVGINSPQNFSKYFTEEFNVSPTDFRKQIPSENAPVINNSPNFSIAVLPFVNMSNDIEQEYFSDGITEEIINVLAKVHSLKVAGRTSCFTFKNKHTDLREMGALLNVNHILEGSVRKSGNKLRITAQLINVEDGYHLWSEKYDREVADIFDIQDEISVAILEEVKLKLFGEENSKVFKRYTNNHQAYQLYLHGRFYHNKFAGVEEFKKAISYFEAAIAIEPNYAIAYSGIASCYLNLWFYRHLEPNKSLPKMMEATQRALELDDEIPESYLALARKQLFFDWDFNAAHEAFKKALSFDWHKAELYGQYALFLGMTGNYAKADENANLALNLDPFSLINNYYSAHIYWLSGNFEKAIGQGKRLVELEPFFWGGHSVIGLNLIHSKRYPEALIALEIALNLNYSGLNLSACGVLYGLSGQIEKAENIIEQMKLLSHTQPIAHYDMAIVYACMGDLDTAISFFEKSIIKHEPPMLFFKFIVRDWLSDFKNDSRYSLLVEKISSKIIG